MCQPISCLSLNSTVQYEQGLEVIYSYEYYSHYVNRHLFGIIIEPLFAVKSVKNAPSFSTTDGFRHHPYQRSEIPLEKQG